MKKKSSYRGAISQSGREVTAALREESRKTKSLISGKGKAARMKSKGGSGSFPTLGDFSKSVPKGGLLNPGLRK